MLRMAARCPTVVDDVLGPLKTGDRAIGQMDHAEIGAVQNVVENLRQMVVFKHGDARSGLAEFQKFLAAHADRDFLKILGRDLRRRRRRRHGNRRLGHGCGRRNRRGCSLPMSRGAMHRRRRRNGGAIGPGNSGADFEQRSRPIGIFHFMRGLSGGLIDLAEDFRESVADLFAGDTAGRSTRGGSCGFHHRLRRSSDSAQEYN